MDKKVLGRSLRHEDVSDVVIRAAIEVHRNLGPGLLESAYETFMAHELSLHGIPFERQTKVSVEYKGVQVDCGFRTDLIVNDAVLVELKAVERILPIHEAQLLSYLKLTRKPVGLLINFNVKMLKDGITRRVL